jgi:hypothetical protein
MAFAARDTAERVSWTKYRHCFTAAVQDVWLSR